MMGAAMLKRHQIVQSFWTSYGVPFGRGNQWPLFSEDFDYSL